jgi:hypothetical protein
MIEATVEKFVILNINSMKAHLTYKEAETLRDILISLPLNAADIAPVLLNEGRCGKEANCPPAGNYHGRIPKSLTEESNNKTPKPPWLGHLVKEGDMGVAETGHVDFSKI